MHSAVRLSLTCSLVLQFSSTMPKLLLVGIVEKTCVKTVIREIPGITDCFMSKEDGKNGETIYTVRTRFTCLRTDAEVKFSSQPTAQISPASGNSLAAMMIA